MRRLVATAALAMVMASTPAIASAGTTTPADWDGAWASVDALDGSNQLLFVGQARSTLRFFIIDFGAAVCGGGIAIGNGATPIAGIADDRVEIVYRARCLDGSPPFTSGVIVYTLTDTLRDEIGGNITTWRHLFG